MSGGSPGSEGSRVGYYCDKRDSREYPVGCRRDNREGHSVGEGGGGGKWVVLGWR